MQEHDSRGVPLTDGALRADLTFPGEDWTVPPARQFIRNFTQRILGYSDAVNDVELCMSEILTNAIEHGLPDCSVTLQVVHNGRLHVEVCSTPVPGMLPELHDELLAENGRGLFLVRALATQWDWEKHDDGTITVWFEKDRPS